MVYELVCTHVQFHNGVNVNVMCLIQCRRCFSLPVRQETKLVGFIRHCFLRFITIFSSVLNQRLFRLASTEKNQLTTTILSEILKIRKHFKCWNDAWPSANFSSKAGTLRSEDISLPKQLTKYYYLVFKVLSQKIQVWTFILPKLQGLNKPHRSLAVLNMHLSVNVHSTYWRVLSIWRLQSRDWKVTECGHPHGKTEADRYPSPL